MIKIVFKWMNFIHILAIIGIAIGVGSLILITHTMEQFQKNQQFHLQAVVNETQLKTIPKDQIKEIEEVKYAQTIIQNEDKIVLNNILGKDLQLKDFHIVLSQNTARQLKVNVGDKVRLLFPEYRRYTLLGSMPNQRLFTVDHLINTEESFVNITDLQKLTNNEKEYQLFVHNPDFQFEAIYDWKIDKADFYKSVKLENNLMNLLIGMIILIAASNILTSISLSIIHKRKEMAILRSIGYSTRQIQLIFLLQGLLTGLIGTVIGISLGIVLLPYMPVQIETISFKIILITSLFSMILSFIATPIKQAKVNIIEVLRS